MPRQGRAATAGPPGLPGRRLPRRTRGGRRERCLAGFELLRGTPEAQLASPSAGNEYESGRLEVNGKVDKKWLSGLFKLLLLLLVTQSEKNSIIS